jgi:hypothetical protein
MKIRLVTAEEALARHVHARLASGGYTGEILCAATADFAVRHRASLPDESLERFLAVVLPLQPEILPAADLDVDIELHLAIRAAGLHLRLAVDTEPLCAALKDELEALGFDVHAVVEPAHEQGLRHSRVAPAIRQLVRSVVARHGVSVGDEPAHDDDVYLRLWVADPRDMDPEAVTASVPIAIQSDDTAAAEQLRARLIAAGFGHARTTFADPGERFEVEPGPLRKAPAAWSALENIVSTYLGERGVDLRRYPLHRSLGDSVSPPRIALPLGAHAAGRLRPSAGPWFERWQIRVRVDDMQLGLRLVERLHMLGFRDVAQDALPGDTPGSVIRWEAAAEHVQVERALRMAIDEILPTPQPLVWTRRDGERPCIELDLVTHMSDADRAQRFAAAAAAVHLVVHAADDAQRPVLADRLARLGVGSLEISHICVLEAPQIWVNQVSDVVATRVVDVVHAVTGVACPLEWRNGDSSTIEVFVPAHASVVRGWRAWQPEPLFDAGEGWLRVADLRLQRWTDAPLETEPLDRPLVEALLHLARCAASATPCLLLGDATAESRRLVQNAARLLGSRVIELDLPSIRADDLRAAFTDAAPETWVVLDRVHGTSPATRTVLTKILSAPPPGIFLCGITTHACSPSDREPWLADHVLRAPKIDELHGLMQAHVYGSPILIALRGSVYRQELAARSALAGLASRPESASLVAALARLAVRIGASRSRALAWLETFAAIDPEPAWYVLLEAAYPEERAALLEMAEGMGVRLA